MRLSDSELSLRSQQNVLKYTHSSPPPSAKNNLLQSGGEPPRFFWIQGIIYCDLVLFQCAAFLKTIHKYPLCNSKPIPFASRSSPLTAFCRHA